VQRTQPFLFALILSLLSVSTGLSQTQIFDADVALDPGHSQVDVGAIGSGLREFELNLEIALRVKLLLEARGYRGVLTRDGPAPLTSLRQSDPLEAIRIEYLARMERIGRVRCFVGINFNGLADSSASGTETYFNADNYGAESRRLADSIQREMLDQLGQAGYQAVDRGVKSDLQIGKPYGHLFQLRGPQPSVTVEGLFLTNPNDSAALWRDEIRQALAEGYSRGVSEYLTGVSVGRASIRDEEGPKSRNRTTMSIASSTIPLDIFDFPTRRSMKMIGTS
jgi:N-acetylmuramoyl-L-alanine amidase